MAVTVVEDIRDRTQVAKALANTYPGDRSGWERVLEYQEVIEYSAAHPRQKSTAISSALDVPRSRIRPWIDNDAKPDPVHAVEAAESYRWLDLDWDTSPFTAINQLVAWIFAGGSIRTQFVPIFTASTARERNHLERLFESLSLEYRVVREDESGRATELIPEEHSTVLGRLLVVLGAPKGVKNDQTSMSLPPYLRTAPETTRLQFARMYVFLRGVERDDRPNWPVQISEKRHPDFKDELRALFTGLLDDPAWITGDSAAKSLYLSPDAARILFRLPETPADTTQ